MEELKGKMVDEAKLVESMGQPANQLETKKEGDRRHTVGDVFRNMRMVAEDGKEIIANLGRAIRRNFARLLYRKMPRPFIDVNSNRLFMYFVNLRREQKAQRDVLVSQMEDAYLQASGMTP